MIESLLTLLAKPFYLSGYPFRLPVGELAGWRIDWDGGIPGGLAGGLRDRPLIAGYCDFPGNFPRPRVPFFDARVPSRPASELYARKRGGARMGAGRFIHKRLLCKIGKRCFCERG